MFLPVAFAAVGQEESSSWGSNVLFSGHWVKMGEIGDRDPHDKNDLRVLPLRCGSGGSLQRSGSREGMAWRAPF